MIKITPLFSGSKGNCTLIQTESANILLDAGYGYKQTLAELSAKNVPPEKIDAVVITHEHGDHISSLGFWSKNFHTKVYAPKDIAEKISARAVGSEVVPVEKSFEIGNLRVDSYACSHDSACCFGYRFKTADDSFASVTDTGCWSQELVDFLAPCRVIQLESNHDVDMLMKGSYSYPLKRRILSDKGHLSNVQTAEILDKLIGTCVKKVILAHLSENNNTKELAFSAVLNMYTSRGVVEGRDIEIYIAEQRGNVETIE